MSTGEGRLTPQDIRELQRSCRTCEHCRNAFIPRCAEYVICERCVADALKQGGLTYKYGEQTMSFDYKDRVAVCTNEAVLLEKQNLTGVLSMRVREFTDNRYGFFMHIHVCLVESFSGPLNEIQKGLDRVDEVKRTIGPKVTWRQDGS